MAGEGQQLAKLPFEVDRASRIDLPRQVTDGLRAAIRSGFFKPGDILPPVQAMRKALGVSVRAPLEAVRCLQDEGLVASRRHVGVVVLGRNEMSWKGHVLVVYPNVTPVFYKTVLEMRLSDRLLDAGWLTTRIMLRGSEAKGYDLTQLAFALKQPLSFVFVLGDRPRLFKYLRASGIPFAGMPNGPEPVPGAVGGIRTDHHAADGDFAGYCASRGVVALTQYGLDASQSFLSAEAFTEKGVRLETREVNIAEDHGTGAGAIVRAAHEAFAGWRPRRAGVALYFADDYIARGAITAMLESGLRLGEDVRVAACSNVGIDLVYGHDITRLETDPAKDADAAASAIIDYLGSRRFAKGVSLAPRLVPGETL